MKQLLQRRECLDAYVVRLKSELDCAREKLAQVNASISADNRRYNRKRDTLKKEIVVEWAQNHLRVGMLVKVKTSAYSSIRRIVKLDTNRNGKIGIFYGEHIHIKRSPDGKMYISGIVEYTTSHGLDKIMGVYNPDNFHYTTIMKHIEETQ